MVHKYQPIENYGVIGDLKTTALVGLNGSIDFMCFPNFDSPSIFAALLDAEKGGKFEITTTNEKIKFKQMYLPNTNILLTRLLTHEGVGEITDFMPVEEVEGRVLIRRVKNVTGRLHYRMRCSPRFNYARTSHKAKQISENEVVFIPEDDFFPSILLKCNHPLHISENDAVANFTLEPGQIADFILRKASHAEDIDVSQCLYNTVEYWQKWSAKSTYKGRWQEIVNRSALILKLMTDKEYGSIIAAPTFSLPEKIGDSKNWDYRYNWIRDSSFTLYGLIRLGYTREAGDFINWLQKYCEDINTPGGLGLMYRLDGSRDLEEVELTHLEGYKESKPVRIGNGAANQLQLDIYGELMDSVYLYNKFGNPISSDFWKALAGQMDWLCENWHRPDEGIWEVREGRQEYLYSRLMCWVALDRAVRLATKRSFPLNNRWTEERDRIYRTIFSEFWDEERQSFVQSKGSKNVDASILLMPLVRFISPIDPKWLSTLAAIEKDLVSDSLVYRYRLEGDTEGLHKGEGTFSLCTFWYVECLARAGKLHKARYYFEKMLGHANHLGLYAEELSYEGEHLGNFPQGFTHFSLISAAYDLNNRLNDAGNKESGEETFEY